MSPLDDNYDTYCRGYEDALEAAARVVEAEIPKDIETSHPEKDGNVISLVMRKLKGEATDLHNAAAFTLTALARRIRALPTGSAASEPK